MYSTYLSPTTLDEALALKAQHADRARILAGGTDLLLEMERGVRKAPDGGPLVLIDLTRIPGLAEIREADGVIHLGPLVTHNQAAASPLISAKALPLARASWEVGAPQIRNRATVAGNLITASPANDTIVPLMAMDASVTLASAERGERTLALADFITGFRKVDMQPDEILVGISFPALTENERGSFIKLGLRKAQAISVVSIAGIVAFTPDGVTVASARISLGAVTAVIGRATEAEAFLVGKALTDDVIDQAAELALKSASPIDDIRAGADYRRGMVRTLTARLLRQLRDGTGAGRLVRPPHHPVGGHRRRLAGQLAPRNSQLATLDRQRPTGKPSRPHESAGQPAGSWLCGRQRGLRRGGMWRLHGLFGRHGGHGLHGPRGTGGGQRSGHRGRTGQPRTSAPDPGCPGAERRRPVRLLHARFRHERGQAVGRTSPPQPGRGRRGLDRQPVPVYGLS